MQRLSRASRRTILGLVGLGAGLLAGCELFTEVRTRNLQVCEPNSIRCGLVNRQVCDDQGTAWIDAACMGTHFICVGEGECVQCLEPSGTLRPDFLVGDCQANLCVDGTIVFIPDDADLYDPAGDCRHVECHDGRIEVTNDDADFVDDGDVCTRQRCEEGYLVVEATTEWNLPCALARGDSTGYSCARTPAGYAYCWGRNDRGQLGLGFADELTYTPMFLSTVYYIRGVSVGLSHACAWNSLGTLWCWGANDFGQARGMVGEDSVFPLGIFLPNLAVWATAGREHSCAVLSDGTAQCWGRNDFGQLGDGTTESRYEPGFVLDAAGNPLTGLVQIEAGASHTCARDDENVLYCWGSADKVGAGGPPEGPPILVPTPVLTGVEKVSTGPAHTCALTTGGKVSCWGNNGYGQCGDPATEGALTSIPTEMADLTDVTTVSAGASHTCATPNTQCWGSNFHGELGQNDGCQSECPGAHSVTPSSVVTSDVYTEVESYNGFSCGLTEVGQIACWGRGDTGQLGNASTENTSSPVYVAWPTNQ